MTADCVILSPREALVAEAAEGFERHLQQLFRGASRHLVIDLSRVDSIDSAGLRALVRAHTTGERLGGSLRLAALQPAVRDRIDAAHLAGVFALYGSVAAARLAAWPWRTIRIAAAGAALCGGLVWAGLSWPAELSGIGDLAQAIQGGTAKAHAVPWHRFQPFIELLKLVAAALVGLLVTAVHQPKTRERSRAMDQAQILLCVSGAMMMIIIGNSLARAFGIAGAASIIRFRTPVDDPKDVTILFLLMGLGMSAGLGAFAVVGLGAAFLCTMLLALGDATTQKSRVMSVEIVATDERFPARHVEDVFARHHIAFEARQISQLDKASVRYQTWMAPDVCLDDLNAQLMSEVAGVKSVAWEPAKRERP
jgi:anti-anti-sigma factor